MGSHAFCQASILDGTWVGFLEPLAPEIGMAGIEEYPVMGRFLPLKGLVPLGLPFQESRLQVIMNGHDPELGVLQGVAVLGADSRHS